MDARDYAAFTERLIEWAETNTAVLGLVALGSMAEQRRTPDEWSDHDFWVVVDSGAAEAMRTTPQWLPDSDRVVLFFRETDHGVKAVYDDGHLVEPAIFEVDELAATRANEYRVLVDKMDLADRMEAIATSTRTEASGPDPSDEYLFGQYLTNLLVGTGRWARGERESGRVLVKQHAVGHLLRLANRHLPSASAGALDDLDPHRRLEFANPEFAERLAVSLAEEVPLAAEGLLGLGQWVVPGLFVTYEPALLTIAAKLAEVAERCRPRHLGIALHHVELAMPGGNEERARAFFGDVLEMDELAKPPTLAGRGGCWFRSAGLEIHVEAAAPFIPAQSAHPGILSGDLDRVAARLETAGHPVEWDPHLPHHRRFSTIDPFGNRLEFLQPEE
jgi:hypothetical protein